MTAEISVMNSIGIALAADSAVTVGRGTKIYNTANKLFALSKYHPIGIMIYGNASHKFMPWETIIKVYRNQLGSKKFDHIPQYGEDFLNFLKFNSYEDLTSNELDEKYTLNSMTLETSELFTFVLDKIKERVNDYPESTDAELFSYGDSILEVILNDLENKEYINGFNDEDLRKLSTDYGDKLEQIILSTFENFIFSESMVTNIKYIVLSTMLKKFNSVSGVVIAGFGEKELYPNLISYEIEGQLNGKLKYKIRNTANIGKESTASIIPFAQDDMVRTFVRGIDPDIENLSFNYLRELFLDLPEIITQKLNEVLDETTSQLVKNELGNSLQTVYNDYREVLNNYKQEYFTTPVLSIVHSLPKEELAEMAEALVNLTSFKRKVSSSIESVGGPVDVAVITKGDGFVWIKRKHYFESNINQQFHQKYYWRDINEPITSREES